MASTDWPRRIDICPWGFWYNQNTVTGTISRLQNSTYLSGGAITTSANQTAIGTYREWKVPLAAGTWAITTIHSTANTMGIIDISLDAVVVDNDRDWYTAGAVTNVVDDVTGIVVATSGIKTLRYEVVSKNASSTNYNMLINWITLKRTA